MEYKRFDELRDLADVHDTASLAETAKPTLTRRERLERWAELLEQDPNRRLRSLGEIETRSRAERLDMRAPDSPLTVAYDDPVLRAAGLKSDKLGDAIAFFELSEGQSHRLLCSCMNGWTMPSGKVARGVQKIAAPTQGLWLSALAATALAGGVPALLYFVA
jgi:hypothetical protein